MTTGAIFTKSRLQTVMSHLHRQRAAQLAIEADALAQKQADDAAQADADNDAADIEADAKARGDAAQASADHAGANS